MRNTRRREGGGGAGVRVRVGRGVLIGYGWVCVLDLGWKDGFMGRDGWLLRAVLDECEWLWETLTGLDEEG